MSLLKEIKEALFGPPPNPRFSVDDLEFHSKQYEDHVEMACDCFDRTLLDKRWSILLREKDGTPPSELIARVRWTYLPNFASWTDREFVPKIRRFCIPRLAVPRQTDCSVTRIGRSDTRPLECGIDHAKAADRHANVVSDSLSYLLCDPRSPFDIPRSMPDESSPAERCRWYADGMRIVRLNIGRISSNFREFVEFAKSNGAR